MKRRSLKAILRKNPGALMFMRQKEIYKIFKKKDIEEALHSSTRYYVEHRKITAQDIENAVRGFGKYGSTRVNVKFLEALRKSGGNFWINRSIGILLLGAGKVEQGYTHHLGYAKRKYINPISERDYNRAGEVLKPFTLYMYQRALLNDFFEYRGVKVSQDYLDRLARPEFVPIEELTEKSFERPVIAQTKAARIARGREIDLARSLTNQVREMLANEFVLTPDERRKVFENFSRKVKGSGDPEMAIANARQKAMQFHNSKLKDLLAKRGLLGLNIPARIGNARATELQKAKVKSRLVLLLAKGPVERAQLEAVIGSIEQVAPQTAVHPVEIRSVGKRIVQRSAIALFFESLKKESILSDSQISRLRSMLSARFGSVRGLSADFYRNFKAHIDKNSESVRGNPQAIMALISPTKYFTARKVRRQIVIPKARTLEELVTETQLPFVKKESMIMLRQRLSRITEGDLREPITAQNARAGVRELILFELARKGFKGRINPQVLRGFAIKSPALSTMFGEELQKLVKSGAVVEHHRGYLTVSLDSSQIKILEKYAAKHAR